jgi:hypothetical protein
MDGGAGGDSRPSGRLTPEDVRQLRRQVREWIADAEAVRRALAREGVATGDLDRLIRELRALDSDDLAPDAAEIAQLQAGVVDGLKRFEFGLRRKLLDTDGQILLNGLNELSPEFRRQVEEYYRLLGKGGR